MECHERITELARAIASEHVSKIGSVHNVFFGSERKVSTGLRVTFAQRRGVAPGSVS